MPSFACNLSGFIFFCIKIAFIGVYFLPSLETCPKPINGKNKCARGARSPEAPTEPCSGTSGI